VSTPGSPTTALVSLTDVAALAGVQRPVPSMWRSRWAASATPFPDAAARIGRRELFALDSVVAWLDQTGLGNSRSVHEEAALFASLEGVANAQVVLDGLEALVALASLSGTTLGTTDGPALLDLADDADPQDACLYREVAALADDAPSWATHADAMVEAGFGVAGALGALARQRARLDLAPATALHLAAISLAAAIARELRAQDDRPEPVLCDPLGSGDLFLAVADAAEVDSPMAVVSTADTPEARSVRQRLVAHGWHLRDVEGTEGSLALPDECIVLTQLPCASRPTMSDLEVVRAVEELALAMATEDRAVVVGPARALANRTRDAATRQVRAEALRTGKVRAVLRLPDGLWPARSREQLAVWVLGPPSEDGPIRETTTAVADVGPTAMTPAVQQDLVTDVVAATSGAMAAHGHAFRFARLVPTSTLVATAGDLAAVVPPLARPRRSPVELALEAERLAAAVSAPAPRVSVDLAHREHGGARTATIGQLLASRAVRLIPANRIDPSDVRLGGGVPVIGPDEVLGARRRGERGVDRLAFAAGYPSGRYTEPNDVVYCTAPAVGALVDRDGLSIAARPARVLRVDPERARGLTPELLAHAIRTGPGAGPWRSWPVRLVPTGQEAALEAALRQADDARADARERLDALDALTRTLVDGVSTGALTLNNPMERDDAHPGQEG